MTATHVFSNDLLQGAREIFPVKDFDIFLDVARLWIWECHYDFEEFLAVLLSL